MRVLLDTNILVSTALFPSSISARAFDKAVSPPYKPVVCDHTLSELHRVFIRKFPSRIADYEQFALRLKLSVEVVATVSYESTHENTIIRDIKDNPILLTALCSHVDAIITGDKDFHATGIIAPKILTAGQF